MTFLAIKINQIRIATIVITIIDPPKVFDAKAKRLTLQVGECLSSYDVTSLFTPVPIDPALNIIKDLLEKDEKLNDRTVLSVQNIIELLGFCLHNTYFSFQNKFYEQVEHEPMGLSVSPIVTNLYMECFGRKALSSAINPPGHGIGLWMIHGSSKNRHINKNSWTTSIAWTQQSSLQWKGLKKMEPFCSLIPLSHHKQTIPYPSRCTKSQPTLTNTCNGTVITVCPPSIVS